MIAVDEGPRRRSGRIAGLEADGDAFKAKVEEEEKEREILRVVSRKEREKVMDVGKMVEDTPEDEIRDMVCTFICQVSSFKGTNVLNKLYRKSTSSPSPSYRTPEPIQRGQYPPEKLMPTLIPSPRKCKGSKMLLKT